MFICFSLPLTHLSDRCPFFLFLLGGLPFSWRPLLRSVCGSLSVFGAVPCEGQAAREPRQRARVPFSDATRRRGAQGGWHSLSSALGLPQPLRFSLLITQRCRWHRSFLSESYSFPSISKEGFKVWNGDRKSQTKRLPFCVCTCVTCHWGGISPFVVGISFKASQLIGTYIFEGCKFWFYICVWS